MWPREKYIQRERQREQQVSVLMKFIIDPAEEEG